MSHFSFRLGGFFAIWILGCQQPSNEEHVEKPGREVAAAALCDELATLVCESDKRCCTAEVVTPSDAGPGDDDTDAGPVDAAPPPAPVTCEGEQLKLCRATLGRLLEDPRLAYKPERGGKMIDELRARSEKCWDKPILYADIAGLFAGSAPPSSDCTPASTSAKDLRAVSLSCTNEASCRVYLRSDGSGEGVCEKRTEQNEDSCSHAFDCGPSRWCKLPKDWKPGLWGRCQPLRAAGWQCVSDLECESGFCGDGVCGPRDESNICLSIGYRKLVLVDQPVSYLRLSEASSTVAKDTSPANHSGELVGKLDSVDGALAKDGDRAIQITAPDTYVKLPIGDALSKGTEFSIEAFVAANEAGPIFELRGSVRTSLRVYRTVDEIRAGFLNPTDGKLLETAATKLDGAWHHIAVTHDGSAGHLYVDGKEVGSVTSPFAIDASDVLYVGYRPAIEPATALTLKGKYDEIAVFPRAAKPTRLLRRRQAAQLGSVTNSFPVFSFLE